MKNKRTWKQWKKDVGNLPMFQQDPEFPETSTMFLIVMLWLTIPLWFMPLSAVVSWLLGAGPK